MEGALMSGKDWVAWPRQKKRLRRLYCFMRVDGQRMQRC
jgi:hypothetical protein